MTHTTEEFVRNLLQKADVQINGSRPWDIQVHNPKFYDRVLSGGRLALGESFMDGWWDCEDISGFIFRALRADLHKEVGMNFETLWTLISANLFNLQNKVGARKVIDVHYNLGNDLYAAFLDPFNQYTCGYFKDTEDLNEAQEKKLDLICRKLQLKRGETLLDIGCGWGGLAKYAAQKYGVVVTGISISDEQIDYAREYCKGLSVTIENRDYRDLTGSFDKVVSVGMFEHVGYKNYRVFMKVVSRVLKDDGLFLLHCIGGNYSATQGDPWMHKYIFPNGMVPSVKQIGDAIEKVFVLEDWHNFGQYYDKTLLAWWRNFESKWSSFSGKYGGERELRMWKYYFLACAGAWRARDVQLWHMVFTKKGLLGGYDSIR